MLIEIKLGREDLERLVKAEIERQMGDVKVTGEVKIETRSKQNYKSEWESADFRATYTQQTKSISIGQ